MRLIPKALAAAVAVAALTPAVASAAPAHNGTFTPSGQPTYLTPGPDGNVWFSITGSTTNKELGKIAPNGTITEYDTPNDRAIVGITVGPDTAGGPNNRIWASYSGGVIKWNPANNTGTDHPIATLAGPRDIAADGAGDIWAVAVDRLVKIKAADGTKIDDVHTGAIGGRDIVRGSDGRMWVADFGSQAITAVGTAAPYPKQSFPTSVAPQGIAAGPAGQLGIALPNSKMGRITTAGAITETTDNATDAFGTAFGADGAYWFAQFNTNTLGRLTPAGGYSKPISLPGAGPRHISAGPNNTLWVSGETSKKIYRITGVTAGGNGGGGGGGGGADTVKPKFSAAKVNGSKRRFTFTLSEAASLRLRVDQRLKGQRRGGKCRTIKRGRRGRKCTLWKNRRSILAEGRAGRNTVSLGRKLGPGAYRLVARATDKAGNVSKRTIRFKVKAKKRNR